MGINRRQFLGWIAAAPLLLQSRASQALNANMDVDDASLLRFTSASQSLTGEHYLHLFDGLGKEIIRHALPGRAHQVISHPTQPWLLAVARRPGTSIEVLDYENGTLVQRINCANDHHLYGHAQITADGRYLLTTENSAQHDDGRLVIRDINNHFQVINEYSTAGIGPHELRLSSDQKTVVIANGGIKTQGREKMNLASMQPSLAYIDVHSGRVLEQVNLPDQYHQSSIRHIDIGAEGQVIIAMQYQGNPGDNVPLIAYHTRGESIKPLNIPLGVHSQLNQYCGSACFDSSGEFAAVSAPRGNLITLWDMRLQQFHAAIKINDGCGLAPTERAGEFLVSTGRGRLYTIDSHTLARNSLAASTDHSIQWDNHLSLVSF
ncbi:DUF1513 domain-containing protein [Neptunomonas antarctica]|uniref:DUF1513 domain-containing protein n=1 Tax=Neptunomonas antarctica TaxID=619304 RepID=A0A1N7IUA3_9GAMM|nr:DUF1513 domain-containing protein [Neptunomonas antarctica]SIS40689.1 hypothetical protein SAMN05421760_101145 [Neptunomonas antarctica]